MTEKFRQFLTDDCEPFILSPGHPTEIKGFVTDERVDRGIVPADWNVYEFRDTCYGNKAALEKTVTVDFGGTFLTKQEIPMPKGYRTLAGRGGYTYADTDDVKELLDG